MGRVMGATEDSERPKRRDSRHERNRVRLMEAAISILLGDGMASFTSARIAEVAGLHKPAFYAHFKNVEECLEAVALHIAQADLQSSLTLSNAALDDASGDDELWRQSIESALRNMLDHANLYRLLLRYKHGEGVLGDTVRTLDERVHHHWTEFFWRWAVRVGIDAKHFRELSELAAHVVGITYFAGELLLTGRTTDVAAEAARVQRYNAAIISAEFRRMLAEPKS